MKLDIIGTSSIVIPYQTTFIPVMHQPCIEGIEEYICTSLTECMQMKRKKTWQM
jgi:hypothetical protein